MKKKSTTIINDDAFDDANDYPTLEMLITMTFTLAPAVVMIVVTLHF